MGLQPLFASAPRIKLRINNNVVGYAIGFNFSVSVQVQPVFILGQFQPVSLEPTMYNTVTGTMQIVRLLNTDHGTAAKNVKDSLSGAATDSSKSVTGAFGDEASTISPANSTASNNPVLQSSLFTHLTPSLLLLSEAFDMHLYMKMPKPATPFGTIASTGGVVTTQASALTAANLIEVAWMKILNCRITSRNTNISMGQLVNEPLNFQGLLAMSDTGDQDTEFKADSKIIQSNG